MTAETDLQSAFRGKRVLITGHTGFKGSWLSTWLLLLGADVTGYALEPSQSPNHFSLLGLERRMRHVISDIRDAEKLRQVFHETKPEVVFHLAAQALVRQSYKDPVETFDVNLRGGVNLLEAVRESDSVRALVFITSDKCYENNEWIWSYRENDRLGGHDPYSASKACAELAFAAYQSSFFYDRALHAATARAGNVIGGGDWSADRIVPDCIRALLGERKIELRHPSATRPWQHVLEPLSGYLTLAARLCGASGPDYEGGWNFGPAAHDCRTVLEVTKGIVANFDEGGAQIEVNTGPSPHEAMLLQLNWEKAFAKLNWRPTWPFETSVAETARWYKRWVDGEDVWSITTAQIEAFSRAATRSAQ